jgi:chromosome segregation ATPase
MVMASIPFIIRLLKPKYARQLAEDVLELMQEVVRLEGELATCQQQLKASHEKIAELRRQRDAALRLLKSAL